MHKMDGGDRLTMATLKDLKGNIDAAKELLKAAEDEYEQAILAKVRSGEVEDRIDAEWNERFVVDKVKVYCTACRAYGIDGVKTARCPNCGAHMRNATYTARVAEVETPALLQPEATPISVKSYDGDTQKQVQIVYGKTDVSPRVMIEELIGKGFAQKDIAELVGVGQTAISAYKRGAVNGTKGHGTKTVAKIRELYEKEVLHA